MTLRLVLSTYQLQYINDVLLQTKENSELEIDWYRAGVDFFLMQYFLLKIMAF